MYIAVANDPLGKTWGAYTVLTTANTKTPYPKLFQNNNTTYLIYNSNTGSTSEKKLIEFSKVGNTILNNNSFINTLSLSGDNQIIANKSDGNNVIVAASEKKLSLFKFYGNDLVINWIAAT